MTSAVPPSTRKARAEEARKHYQHLRVQRLSAQQDDLADPLVAAIIDPTDGTLDKEALKADLPVQVALWDVPLFDGDTDTVQLQMSMGDDTFVAVGAALAITAPVDPATFPRTLALPKSELAADGPRKLRYHIKRYNFLDNYSPAIDLIVDGTPPWEDATPAQIALPSEAITDAYLAANPAGVVGTLPAYDNQQPTDKVAFYYLKAPLPSDPADLPAPVGFIAVPDNREVVFPVANIQQLGDGGCHACYVVIDKAHNESRLSLYATLNVALGALPTGLGAPVVPLAADGLVDLADARTGVVVHIPTFSNWKNTDQIEVKWGSHTLAAEQIGSSPIFPFPVRIPNEVLKAEYGAATGEVEIEVSYSVLRGTVPFGPEKATVKVDFSVIGPVRPVPDPDWPDPINTDLLAPEVRGKTSDTANTLERTDAGQDAELTFDLYTNAIDGELVDFYWGDTLVKEASHTVDTGAGPKIKVEILWKYILDAGNNPALPVHYRIRAADSTNEQYSVAARVAVDAITLTPDAPTFQGEAPNGWLNCDSLWEDPTNPSGAPAIRVDIPDLSQYLKAGDVLTVTWTPLSGRVGEDVIATAIKTEDITLDASHPASGFTWLVEPYATHILPLHDLANGKPDGRARVEYAFDYKGEKITSAQLETVVSLGTGAGTCVIP
ncbi:hypothetical protein CCOS865_04329 [Pseudomonas reidholzensis]|uniref:Uncharacterized protein n=1 Tax=Pseudomonas reidholzensis TaxID=1785162 RepID=A0A383RYA3_9PSED|nr:hypothetical protein [Pseudomonas reidholzensis]SYX92049.1 hypothetical protein CCOS865_04329 [Pseudomonas reidholzensis]